MAGKPPSCVGAPSFNPTAAITDAHVEAYAQALALLDKDDFAGAIRAYFGIHPSDAYVYHAITSVTLPQVQHVVELGGKNGLHAWYWSATPSPLEPPPSQDIDAYISLFALGSNPTSALRSFAANAKRSSLRASIAAHLTSNRYIHPGAAPLLPLSSSTSNSSKKKKKKPSSSPTTTPTVNPYYDFWAWSTRNLEWAGPSPESEARPQSHHILPILMHHFGCAVPSPEALNILATLADGRPVLDMGSGNGYWAFVLRHSANITVVPVDNAQSAWRVNWVPDTIITDGARYLSRNAGGKDAVLLMVYPVVGGGAGGGVEGGFTRGLMTAYKGDTVAVVGTQNHNGYTSFRGLTFAEYMAAEQKDWTKVLQVPLPSFAGKDEALFVYQRGERAARLEAAAAAAAAAAASEGGTSSVTLGESR